MEKNEKKSIITIAGKLGSGKSSASKELAHRLGFQHFSSGDFLRKVAEDRNISIKELMIAAESDSQIDYDIDQVLRDKGTEEDLVIDSRLAFYWIPESFKVYLEIDPEIAAQRMFLNLNENEDRKRTENSESVEEMKNNMIARHESDKKRYQNLYNLNHTDHSHFDLVIDTGLSENNLETVVQKIIENYNSWKHQ